MAITYRVILFFIIANTSVLFIVHSALPELKFSSMVLLATVAVAIIMGIFLNSSVSRSIKEVLHAVTQFGNGDFSVRVVENCRNDEIGKLGKRSNVVFKRLAEYIDDLEIKISYIEQLKILANAANESETIDEMIEGYLHTLCSFSGWPVGHVYKVSRNGKKLHSTKIWYLSDEEAYKDFKRITESTPLSIGQGTPGAVLEKRRFQWYSNPVAGKFFVRFTIAKKEKIDLKLKTNFAFPIFVGKNCKVAYVLEVWSDQDIERTKHLEEFASQLSLQLGHVMDREAAHSLMVTHQETLKKTVEKKTQDIKKAKEEAEQANNAKTDYLNHVSHELRTPLHGILSYAGLAKDRVDTMAKEKLSSYLGIINNSGNKLLGILDDLLDLAKLEAGKMEFRFKECNIATVLKDLKDEQKALFESKNLKFSIKRTTGINTEIEADSGRIMQVLRNIVNNAVKFTPNDKKITAEISQAKVKYNNRNRPALSISISDQGQGIPESELEDVFDKFSQSSKNKKVSGSGTGLGLSICREIVKEHGGIIYAENNEKIGAKFTLVIPVKTPADIKKQHKDSEEEFM